MATQDAGFAARGTEIRGGVASWRNAAVASSVSAAAIASAASEFVCMMRRKGVMRGNVWHE